MKVRLTENQMTIIENLINEEEMSSIIDNAKVGDTIVVNIGGEENRLEVNNVFSDQIVITYGNDKYALTSNSFRDNSLKAFKFEPDGSHRKVTFRDVQDIVLEPSEVEPDPDAEPKIKSVRSGEPSAKEKQDREERIRDMVKNNPRLKAALRLQPSLFGRLMGKKTHYVEPKFGKGVGGDIFKPRNEIRFELLDDIILNIPENILDRDVSLSKGLKLNDKAINTNTIRIRSTNPIWRKNAAGSYEYVIKFQNDKVQDDVYKTTVTLVVQTPSGEENYEQSTTSIIKVLDYNYYG